MIKSDVLTCTVYICTLQNIFNLYHTKYIFPCLDFCYNFLTPYINYNVLIKKMMDRKNQYGRSYVNGKALSDDLASLVVADFCEMGGNIETKYVPIGVRTEVAYKYKLCKDTVNKV